MKNCANISDADYQKYVENFDPDLFDSKHTDYKSTNTPVPSVGSA